MKKIKISAIFGTRPEAIKMCPLIIELKKRPHFSVRVCLTGQHGDMVKDIMRGFDLSYHSDLNIMTHSQTLFDITERSLKLVKKELSDHTPDLVLVHGDTSNAFAAALAAFYMKIPVGHVEAGLRTGNIHSPFPEEFNRRAIDSIASLCFCPTEKSMQNLIAEGKASNDCFVTGNTVVDALKYTTKHTQKACGEKLRVLMTVHRRENLGEPLGKVLRAVLRTATKHENVEFIFPVHPNPLIRKQVSEIFNTIPPNIILTEPMNVFPFHKLLASCHLVLTDSGGIQEEAASLNIPLILARDTTERPEAAECGGMVIAGVEEEKIFSALCELIENKALREKMAIVKNPFGDGNASIRIADIISSYAQKISP